MTPAGPSVLTGRPLGFDRDVRRSARAEADGRVVGPPDDGAPRSRSRRRRHRRTRGNRRFQRSPGRRMAVPREVRGEAAGRTAGAASGSRSAAAGVVFVATEVAAEVVLDAPCSADAASRGIFAFGRRPRGRRGASDTAGASRSLGGANIGMRHGNTRRSGTCARRGSIAGVGRGGISARASAGDVANGVRHGSAPEGGRAMVWVSEAVDVRVCLTSTTKGRALRRFIEKRS